MRQGLRIVPRIVGLALLPYLRRAYLHLASPGPMVATLLAHITARLTSQPDRGRVDRPLLPLVYGSQMPQVGDLHHADQDRPDKNRKFKPRAGLKPLGE